MIRKAPTRITILLAGICLVLVTAYWVTAPYWHARAKTLREQQEFKSFRDRLALAIEGTDQIDLVEHSGMLDFHKADGIPDEKHSRIEYARITLSANQKGELAVIVRDAQPMECISFDMPDPHHSFEFRHNGILTQWLSICVLSQHLMWYNKPGDPWIEEQTMEAAGLINSLETYIKKCGFRVRINWQEIAEQTVPSDGHKPSNSAPSSDTTAPADAH